MEALLWRYGVERGNRENGGITMEIRQSEGIWRMEALLWRYGAKRGNRENGGITMEIRRRARE